MNRVFAAVVKMLHKIANFGYSRMSEKSVDEMIGVVENKLKRQRIAMNLFIRPIV